MKVNGHSSENLAGSRRLKRWKLPLPAAPTTSALFFARKVRGISKSTRSRNSQLQARGRVKIVALTVDANDEALQEDRRRSFAPDILNFMAMKRRRASRPSDRRFGREVIKAIPSQRPVTRTRRATMRALRTSSSSTRRLLPAQRCRRQWASVRLDVLDGVSGGCRSCSRVAYSRIMSLRPSL